MACKESSLAPSAIGRQHRIPHATLEHVAREAVSLHARGGAAAGPVVWRDGTDELLVEPEKVRVATRERLIFVGLPVFCEESGHTEVTVVFACNSEQAPLGVVLTAEATPRGPRVVVERWAEPLVACAYAALLESLAALVEGAPGEHLTLAGFGAGKEGVVVVMQRDHDVQSTPAAGDTHTRDPRAQ